MAQGVLRRGDGGFVWEIMLSGEAMAFPLAEEWPGGFVTWPLWRPNRIGMSMAEVIMGSFGIAACEAGVGRP
jgi:hypothetical protein